MKTIVDTDIPHMDFTNLDNACRVDYDMVHVRAPHTAYPQETTRAALRAATAAASARALLHPLPSVARRAMPHRPEWT